MMADSRLPAAAAAAGLAALGLVAFELYRTDRQALQRLLRSVGVTQVLRAVGAWRRSRGWGSSRRAVADGLPGLVGNTPLVRLRSLSEATGCEILAKAEFLNPGGSVKDRVALEILQEALASGRLAPGGLVAEGTVGSTGVSLAMAAAAFGCRAFIAMPDDAALEKSQLLEALGAEVRRVRPVSITHPDHFVNVARRRAAEEGPNALFADQFENLANFRAHLKTGREIWEQSGGAVDAFVSGAGTGGTIAGVSAYLKGRDPRVKVFLIDPPGSGLYNKVTRGVMFSREEAEGRRLKHPFDTVTEGIGINRLTANFAAAQVDGGFQGTDREAVQMAQYLLHAEGLFVGSSAAMNCVGAVKAARALGPGHTVVTVLCDGGQRHLSKFHSAAYLAEQGLTPSPSTAGLDFAIGLKEAWGGSPRALSDYPASTVQVFSMDSLEELEQPSAATPCAADSATGPVADNVRWLLAPNTEEERLLQLHTAVEVEYAEAQAHAALEPSALAAGLSRLGYTALLHTPGDHDKALRRKLCGLRHDYVTVCLPDAGEAGTHSVVVDPHFKDAFVVAHPTARYRAVLDAVPAIVVATKVSLRRAVALLSREMALSFSDQGLSTPPWRTATAMLSRWELQPGAAFPAVSVDANTAGYAAHVGQLTAAFKSKATLV